LNPFTLKREADVSAIPQRHKPRKQTTWAIPLIYMVITMVLGMALPRVEHHVFPNLVSTMSPAAAMGICSAVSSGMIALTGIVFSLAFVMVQFSAVAYSPRLALWLARDRVMSHAMGMFSATFLYGLIMMAWVDRSTLGRVPLVSGWMVLILLLASMGMFIALIERIGLLQINRMLLFIGARGRKSIDDLYCADHSAKANSEAAADYREKKVTQTLTHKGAPKVVQAVEMVALMDLATQADAVIEVAAAVGSSVLEMTPLIRVYGANHQLDETILRKAVEIGEVRTFEQDPKYALRLVVDIAIKALSSAINDPTTAVQALDQIEDLLLCLGRRQLEIGRYRDASGALRLVIPFPSWDNFLRLALDEIRFCGANSVQVMRRMKALIENLLSVLPPERHEALRHWEERLENTIGRTFADAEEKQDALVADRQGLGIGEQKSNGE
jgi:uncharacterized membrane protein